MTRTRAQILERRSLEVEIDDFGWFGEGRVRLDDGWLSVPGTLPGEVVRVQVQPEQDPGSRRLDAEVVEVMEASSDRRNPLCERDRACRGCQLRHMTVAAELEWKVRSVREAVERYAELRPADLPQVEVVTPQPIARGDAFRIRTGLSYRRRGDDFEMGLVTPVDEGVIPMEKCPALEGPVRRLVTTVIDSLESCRVYPWDQSMVREVRQRVEDIEISPGIKMIDVVSPTHGVGLVDIQITATADRDHFQREIGGEAYGPWIERLTNAVPDQVGVAISAPEHRHYAKEPRRIRVPIDKWEMEVGYDDWFHTTLKPAERVYEQTMDWLELEKGDRLVDVGCGTGTISLMVSERVDQVVGVDHNPASIEAAEINAVVHGRTNVRFEIGGWEKALRNLAMDDESFSVATINPMREPLGRRALAFLRKLGVERLVYLGPSPEAAARDIGALCEMGWELDRLAAANLHPATYHTMLMARLRDENENRCRPKTR